jgi:hypothetical protein
MAGVSLTIREPKESRQVNATLFFAMLLIGCRDISCTRTRFRALVGSPPLHLGGEEPFGKGS